MGDPDIYTNVICHCVGDCADCDDVVGIADFLELLAQFDTSDPMRPGCQRQRRDRGLPRAAGSLGRLPRVLVISGLADQ